MTKLKPYQRDGVFAIRAFRGRALLADEQGLGKTIQALDWVRRLPSRRPVVIVCPSSVKYTWQSEALQHFGMRAEVVEGNAPKKHASLEGDLLILNYDILPSWLPVLRKLRPQIVICDEIHYIKNERARRSRAVQKLTKQARSVVGLSGTPFTNRPMELWSVLRAINPRLFPDRLEFAWEFCKPRWTPWGWKFDGCVNAKRLRKILYRKVMIRRLKKDVLSELPPKERRAVPFKLDDYSEYQEAQKNFIGWLRKRNPSRASSAERNEALTKVGYLLRLCAELKLRWTERWIADFLEDNPKEKLVGLTMHRKVVDHLLERFRGKVLHIDGRVKGKRRHETVRAFQSNPRYPLLIGNWKAAGVGITLTAASNVAALDLPWTPGDLLQGEDRIHRIGQKKRCVIHYLIAKDTLEEKQVKWLQRKSQMLEDVLNGLANADELNMFEELLLEMKKDQTI